MELAKELKKIVSGEVLSDEENLAKYSRDASLFEIRPEVVVFPETAADVKALVKYVTKNKKKHPKLSLTARSAGTDMTGGPLNDSVILDFTKHMNRVKEVDAQGKYAVTEPGVYYRDFEKETLKHKLLFPSYPASRAICAMGGIVANNAGGEKTLTYGKTEDYVAALKAVLYDGNEYLFGPLSTNELNRKLRLRGTEGNIYRKIYRLIRDNYKLIMAAKPDVSKNSAGYYLWNVYDVKRGIFDLTKLFTGSQGTLGIITEVSFRLVRPKEHSTLLVIFLKELSLLAGIVERVLAYKPESFESYDDHTMKIAVRFLPDFLKLMGAKNMLSLAWQFLPEIGMIITGGVPKLILEAEFTGDSEEEVYRKAYAAQAGLKGLGVRTRVTKRDGEEEKYWTVRRESFNLLRHHVHGKRTAPFIDDLVVRPERLPEFLPRLTKIMNEYNLIYTIAGHIGDGNFHIIPLMDMADPRSIKIIPELAERVYKLVKEFRGSIDGEHNDGLIRTPYLKTMYGSKVYALFEKVKKIFDPLGIFNPGKKVGTDIASALTHITRS